MSDNDRDDDRRAPEEPDLPAETRAIVLYEPPATGETCSLCGQKMRRKGGGPGSGKGSPLFTDELRHQILKTLREGATKEAAAEAAGLHRVTLWKWLDRGRAGIEPYATFADEIAQAQAIAENEDIKVIRSAGYQDWKARAWVRERSNPKDWGVQDKFQSEMRAAFDRLAGYYPEEQVREIVGVLSGEIGPRALPGPRSEEPR